MKIFSRLAPLIAFALGVASISKAAVVNVSEPIATSVTWTKDQEYLLSKLIYVLQGATLTIEPGTVIKALPGTDADTKGLVVTVGAKIIANGTAEAPIIFTAEEDDVNDPDDLPLFRRGLWGGVVILGKAVLNTTVDAAGNAATPKYELFEGLPDTQINGQFVNRFGGNDDDDNSGVFRYVSIRHAGVVFQPNKELNGLSLGAVGRGTTLEHVEVYAAADDGFEFFGGTVNTKWLVSAFNDDDAFDTDMGYRGKNQFWFAIQEPGKKDHGGELNGEPNGAAVNAAPIANFEVYNATWIGAGTNTVANRGMTIREYAAPKFYNSIFTEFGGSAVRVDAKSATHLATGVLDLRDNVFWNFATNGIPVPLAETAEAGPLFTEMARNNVNVDPLLTGISRAVDGGLDPRPQAGSPALATTRATPGDGFYTAAPFKGAFDANNLWLRGWTVLDQLGMISDSDPLDPNAPIEVTENIAANTTWKKGPPYILSKLIYVLQGATLTIEPGTVIKALPGTDADTKGLVVTVGAKIMANGTAEEPIIFTAEEDDVNDPDDLPLFRRGLWGGVVILGKAVLNTTVDAAGNAATPKYELFEGLPDTQINGQFVNRFGGNDDDDNSGVIRYVSIRHAGVVFQPNKELNGLSLGAVGRGTTIEHVEVYAAADDGFEFFGGTVNTKWLVSAFNDDDAFDTDMGYRGKNQFWFAIQEPGKKDHGGELNGEPNGAAVNAAPIANFEVYNATWIGAGTNTVANRGMTIREYAAPKFYNSIFTEFGGSAVRVDAKSATHLATGVLDLRDNVFWNFATNGIPVPLAETAEAGPLFTETARNNVNVDPLLTGISRAVDGGLDPRPQAGSPALTTTRATPGDGFYTAAPFKGAFDANNLWLRGWTVLDQLGMISDSDPLDPNAPIEVTENIAANTTWKKGPPYILSKLIYVLQGATLTIEPGTVIKALPGTDADTKGLVVTVGAKIIANGTAEAPIIFTAEEDDVNDPDDLPLFRRGLWGGVVILGKAVLNTTVDAAGNAATPKYELFEGLPDTQINGQFVNRFGGNDDDDNSGVFRYVSIRHAGVVFQPNKELNGLSLGAVGRGTTLEHVEVYAAADDGFEFFGGTVNTKWLVSAFNDDDAFDTDMGYRGKNQFWFAIQEPGKKDHGGELNGEPNGAAVNGLPASIFEVWNATWIGAGTNTAANRGMTIREYSSPKFYNSIFTEFGGSAVRVDAKSATYLAAGLLDLRDNIFWNFATNGIPVPLAETAQAQPLFADSSRNNVQVNPLLRGIGRDTNEVLDPRPALASPALSPGRPTPNDGFLTAAGYKGAFNGSDLWLRGWTFLDQAGMLSKKNPVLDPNAPIEVVDDIVTSTTWKKGPPYILSKLIYVLQGATLTIEPGTVIKALPGTDADTKGLVVTVGAKIMANGTAEEPIIFTAEEDDVNDPDDLPLFRRGLWGGVVILGKAVLNTTVDAAGNAATPKYELFEGLPDTQINGQFVNRFGGNDDDDNSGIFRYVSIRHAGVVFQPNKELNGLSLGAVGRGTTLEHVEVYAAADDGFEFFGGTVNTKWLVSAFNDDDAFDTDMGYRGKNQFWFAIQEPGKKDHGGELNGEPNGAAVNAAPIANFEVYNATWIGAGTNTVANRGMTIREYAAPKFYNSIFTEFGGSAVRVDAKSATHLATGVLDLRDNVFWNFATNGIPVPLAETAEAGPLFTETARNNVNVDPLLTGISRAVDGGLDPRPQAGSPALTTTRATPGDGFYTAAPFKGAFDANNLWLRGWTVLDQLGMLSDSDPVTIPTLSATLEGNSLKVSFDSVSGRQYELELSADLSIWTSGPTLISTGPITATLLALDQPARFIRVRVR